MAYGDHIYVKRTLYSHHGVQVSDREVIHFTGEPGNKRDAAIRRDSLDDFAQGGTIIVRTYARRNSRDDTVAAAESKLGRSGYHLFGNNCEHFARWCATNDHRSAQVNAALAATGVGASTGAAAAGGVGVVSTAGVVTGLSGSGIMSGLATAGATVGGGAVAGLVVLGAAPGMMSAAVMNIALRDDDALPADERNARSVGRKASVAGVAGGGAAGLATVSAAGSVAGLSAAGITSGLATIGSVVGGGMTAGSAIVIAGPAVAAAGLGYGAYRVAGTLGFSDSSPGRQIRERLRDRTARLRSRGDHDDDPG